MILVTGATGFIGRYVTKELLKSGEKVRCLVRNNKNLPRSKKIEVCIGDIRDKKRVDNAVKGCKIIIHLAAVLNPYNKDIYDINVNGTKNLINAAKKYGVKRFIFASTETVILTEKDNYCKSKAYAEKIVQKFKNHVILRFVAVYGKNCRGNISLLLNIVKKSKFVPVIGNGKSLMQPLYIGDAVKYILNAIRYGNGNYIVAGGSAISMNDLIDNMAKQLNKKRIKIHLPFSLTYLLIKLYTKIIKNPKISPVQIYYLNVNNVYDISRTTKELKHKPAGIIEGLSLTRKN